MHLIKNMGVLRKAILLAVAALLPLAVSAMKVESDRTVTGFKFPESVGYDATAKVLYVGSFGGTELKPGEKDGKGYVSKVSLDGKMLEERWVPAFGEVMNKPKGIWVVGNRMWT